jgi:hypothetical protein
MNVGINARHMSLFVPLGQEIILLTYYNQNSENNITFQDSSPLRLQTIRRWSTIFEVSPMTCYCDGRL